MTSEEGIDAVTILVNLLPRWAASAAPALDGHGEFDLRDALGASLFRLPASRHQVAFNQIPLLM